MKLWLCVVLAAFFATAAPAQAKKNVDVNKLSSQKKAVDKKQARINRELRENKADQRAVRRTIQDLDASLNTIQTDLVDTETRLHQSRMDQKRLAQETAVAKSRLQERREQARKRLRQLYIRGNASIASAIVGSRSMGDLASRKFLFQRVTQRDKQLFEEVRQLHETVRRQKENTDKLVVRIDGLLDRQKQRQNDLRYTRNEKRDTLVTLKDRQGDLEKLKAELEAEERAIEASLASYYATRGKTTGLKFSGRLGMPASGRLGSGFGMRRHPVLGYVRMHKGVDIGAPSGSAIRASADGIVIAASYMRGYGNCIIVDHGGGISTLYAHCSRIMVGNGARVKRGQTIGKVGQTGLATGPHLHFEVRVNGKAVNPRSWL